MQAGQQTLTLPRAEADVISQGKVFRDEDACPAGLAIPERGWQRPQIRQEEFQAGCRQAGRPSRMRFVPECLYSSGLESFHPTLHTACRLAELVGNAATAHSVRHQENAVQFVQENAQKLTRVIRRPNFCATGPPEKRTVCASRVLPSFTPTLACQEGADATRIMSCSRTHRNRHLLCLGETCQSWMTRKPGLGNFISSTRPSLTRDAVIAR